MPEVMTPDDLTAHNIAALAPDGAVPMESQAAFDRWTMGRERPGEHDRVVASLVLWMQRMALTTSYEALATQWGKNRGTLYRCLNMVHEMLEEDVTFRYQAAQAMPELKLVDQGMFSDFST